MLQLKQIRLFLLHNKKKKLTTVFHPHADGQHQKTISCFDITHSLSQHQVTLKNNHIIWCFTALDYINLSQKGTQLFNIEKQNLNYKSNATKSAI